MATMPQAEPAQPTVQGRSPRPKRTREEMMAIFRAAREEVQAHNPTGRDLLAELIAERRAASAHE